MTQVTGDAGAEEPRRAWSRWIQPIAAGVKGAQMGARTMEVDIRLAGMILALIAIWLGFGYASNGLFLTPRNLYDVSVQSVPVAIMATGMVLIIVSRNIDLSVGSIMGFTAYMMAMTQAIWIPTTLGLGYNVFYIWIVALIVGVALGALIGAIQGGLIAYVGIPSFIVTLGGLLIWRGLIFKVQQGQTIAPMDNNFSIIGGNLPQGSIGLWPTWIVGIVVCAGIVYALLASRRKRREYGFPVRPRWALAILMVGGCATVLGAMWAYNNYPLPPLLATKYAVAHGITEPPGGLIIPVGLAAPVLLLGAVTLGMMFLATRRPFGRYVFSIGGNPEAAILAGINAKRTILGTFVLMGMLCAIAAAVQTARLNAGVTSTGTGYELLVIAAAVIGGTSFAGGIGTIPGAVLGAVVMQSLKSGMVTIGVDSPMQDVAVGSVLIMAVALDSLIQRRAK
ncbi:MAG TPA: sugar ABC transporter permease [Candidatus Limnocylindrales bacterium]|nr:sugar ABC transporter permease [Candidatus Limnocylindrales bacterium]